MLIELVDSCPVSSVLCTSLKSYVQHLSLLLHLLLPCSGKSIEGTSQLWLFLVAMSKYKCFVRIPS